MTGFVGGKAADEAPGWSTKPPSDFPTTTWEPETATRVTVC